MYEIHYDYFSWWRDLLGKIISIKHNRYFKLGLFSQMAISLLIYIATFSGQLYFRRSYFLPLPQTNYIDTMVTFSGQLFLQSSCFYEELLFQKGHFFAAVTIWEWLYFQSDTSIEQPFPENRSFFRSFSFWNSYLFDGGII